MIEDVDIVFEPGLTAITGETGAGKTLVVEALELLVGGRAEPSVVRSGADQATIEGRFVLRRRDRAAPRRPAHRSVACRDRRQDGADLRARRARSRPRRPPRAAHAPVAFAIAGAARGARSFRRASSSMTCAPFAERSPNSMRRSWRSAGTNDSASVNSTCCVTSSTRSPAPRSWRPTRTSDSPERKRSCASATALKEAVADAYAVVHGGERAGVLDRLGEARAQLERFDALRPLTDRMRAVIAELDDLAGELRLAGERFEEDPRRLDAVRARRQLLRDLVRKHGDELADVLRAAEEIAARIAEIESADERRTAALRRTRRSCAPRSCDAEQRRRRPAAQSRRRARRVGRRPPSPPRDAQRPPGGRRSPQTASATTSSSVSARTAASRACRSPRSPRAASSPGRCSPCASCSPPRHRRSSSTRSTPGSAARRRSRSGARSPSSDGATRFSSSPTSPRSRPTRTTNSSSKSTN